MNNQKFYSLFFTRGRNPIQKQVRHLRVIFPGFLEKGKIKISKTKLFINHFLATYM